MEKFEEELRKSGKLIFKIKTPYSQLTLNKKINNLLEFVTIGNASVSKGFKGFTGIPMRVVSIGWYMIYYYFNKKGANLQSMKFSINPDLDIMKTIWNLMDKKGINSLLKVALPSIKYRKNLYLLKTSQTLNFEILDNLIENRRI